MPFFNVDVINDRVSVPAGMVNIEITDRSGCHVDAVLAIQTLAPTTFHFSVADTGKVSQGYLLAAGTYNCSLLVLAYAHATVNRNYDIRLKVYATQMLSARGDVPEDPGYCRGLGEFTLVVV